MERPASMSLHLGVRERWLTTTLLGLGLITFAINASNTQLILPQLMTSLHVKVYQIHWALTAPGIARTVVIAATGWLIHLRARALRYPRPHAAIMPPLLLL